jgi:hypothetical protein
VFIQPLGSGYAVHKGDSLKVSVDAVASVGVLDYEKSRLSQEIEARIAAQEKAAGAQQAAANYEVDVNLTQYERGSAFARMMLAGLGQIHIAADVQVYVLPVKTRVGEFSIKKTFAWGGMYGGTTSMETVELGFADGIAAAVTGPAPAP